MPFCLAHSLATQVEESDEEEQVFQLVVKQTFLEYIPTARRVAKRAQGSLAVFALEAEATSER